MSYKVIKLGEGFWTIQDKDVRMFLLSCGKEAGGLLIDTGFGKGNLKGLVHMLVEGDVSVINTHSHFDHTGGDHYFETVYMNEADRPEIEPVLAEGTVIKLVRDGEVIRKGDVELEVVEIPGHTPGSIALLDRKNRRLFSADSVARNYPVYMQYPVQDIDKYRNSLYRLEALSDAYDYIFPCHGDLDIDKSDLEKEIRCVEGILDGSIPPGSHPNSEGLPERAYYYKSAIIFH